LDNLAKLSSFEAEGMTPKMFQYNLVKRAKKHRKHVFLKEMMTESLARFTLVSNGWSILGNKKQIENKV
jgi:phosphate acetyltransferase